MNKSESEKQADIVKPPSYIVIATLFFSVAWITCVISSHVAMKGAQYGVILLADTPIPRLTVLWLKLTESIYGSSSLTLIISLIPLVIFSTIYLQLYRQTVVRNAHLWLLMVILLSTTIITCIGSLSAALPVMKWNDGLQTNSTKSHDQL